MPEIPDITLYIEALEDRICNATLIGIDLHSPFFLRSVEPAPAQLFGRKITEIRRIGKRVCIGLESGYWLVIHLMIAGRLQWSQKAPKRKARNVLADFTFTSGTMRITEAGTKKRASLYVAGPGKVAEHDPGGLEVLDSSLGEFRLRLKLRNHTLRRALTDPRLFSGIGNAYSDEILHAAGLSPLAMTQRLEDDAIERLHNSIKSVLSGWTTRLRDFYDGKFPTRVTAFRDGMSVHGRFGKPCPDCGTTVQRIRYASNETNYCPMCQTGGKILADRSLSKLLKKDWPRTVEELERQALRRDRY